MGQADDHQIEATLTALVFKMEQGADGPQTTLLCGDWRLALQRRGEHWLITSLVVQPLTPP